MSTVATRDTLQSSALSVANGQEFWTPSQVAALRQVGIENASNGDLAVFLNYAQRTGLDPFARQIYMIGREDRRAGTTKWTIQASIDGLRIVAQRSREYAGQVGPEWCGPDGVWRDVWLPDEAPVAARVGVLRKGFAQPLYAVALVKEYASTYKDRHTDEVRLSGLWGTKPAVMIAKCAEALALRKAFPMDLSGLYTAEEAELEDRAIAVQEEQQESVRPAAARRGARAEEAAPVEGRDWLAEVEAATSTEELRAIYNAARDATDVPAGLAERITEKAQRLAQGPDVVDAEIVDEPPAETAA